MNQPKVIYDENGKVLYSVYAHSTISAGTEEEEILLKYDETKKVRKYKRLNPMQKELVEELFPIKMEKPDPTSKKF